MTFFSVRAWTGSILSAAFLLLALTGCGGSGDAKKDGKGGDSAKTDGKPQPKLAAGEEVTIGFIYVGPKDDYGYNQAHAEGAAAVKKMDKVKMVEEEKIPETV